MQLLQLTVAGLLAAAPVLATGINCKGSIHCYYLFTPGMKDKTDLPQALTLAKHINSLPDDLWIPAEQMIACAHTICAKIHYVDGMYAKEVKKLADEIVRHGCERCGNCPRGYPDSNDSSLGKLSFQRERHMCVNGDPIDTVCPPFWDGLAAKRDIAGSTFHQQSQSVQQSAANGTYTAFVA